MAQNYHPRSIFIGLGAQRGTVAMTHSESSRKGRGRVEELAGRTTVARRRAGCELRLCSTAEGALRGTQSCDRCRPQQTNCRDIEP